jgi:hypothetical protein
VEDVTETTPEPVVVDAPAADATPAPSPAADPAPEPSALEALEAALEEDWPLAGDDEPAKPTGQAQPPADAPKPEGEKKAEPKPERAFTIRTVDGKETEIAWPKGAEIVFKSEGKERKVDTLDRLVELAQKGDLLDRKAGEFGREKQTLTREKEDLSRQLAASRAEAEEQVQEAERVLRTVLNDPEAAKRVKKALAAYDDPNATRARETEEENERLKSEREQETEQRRTQATERFWGKARERVADSVGEGKRFPMLADEDGEEIVGRFWEGYHTHTVDLFERYVSGGLSEEEATERAAKEGLAWLTEENLYGVMTEMNARLERRFGSRRQDPAETEADPEEKDLAAADAHNRHVNRKLEQRATTRTIKGPAAPARTPATAVPEGGDHESAIDKEWDSLMSRL